MTWAPASVGAHGAFERDRVLLSGADPGEELLAFGGFLEHDLRDHADRAVGALRGAERGVEDGVLRQRGGGELVEAVRVRRRGAGDAEAARRRSVLEHGHCLAGFGARRAGRLPVGKRCFAARHEAWGDIEGQSAVAGARAVPARAVVVGARGRRGRTGERHQGERQRRRQLG